MAAPRKRPREIDEASRAECPFQIRLIDQKERDLKKKKRRKEEDPDDANAKIPPLQLSPFAPTGKFKTYETMDIAYTVEPSSASKRWSDMTRYNSFVLNGSKYFSDNYIFVANESTIERQKAGSPPQGPRTHSEDDWVARILEIRASDEHHVYARVYWMYWPDELPSNTLDGRKTVCGRQPYHGQGELIASNHMDIINVVSVTQQATVNQVTDENDDQVQQALYWRQALDVRTFELSAVDRVCKCNEPGNPDRVLIGCPKDSCKKWLHEECMKHAILTKIFQELGADKPHKAPGADAKDVKEEEVKRPLSPVEPGSGTVAGALPIQVKTTSDTAADGKVASDSVDVKDIKKEGSSVQTKTGQASTSAGGKEEPPRKTGRGRKKTADDPNAKPYDGLFEAAFNPDKDKFEIKDLRGLPGGDKSWLEVAHCLLCGTRIDE